MGELIRKNTKNFNGIPFKLKIPTLRCDMENVWVSTFLTFSDVEMGSIQLNRIRIKKGNKKLKVDNISEEFKSKLTELPISACINRDIKFSLFDCILEFQFSSDKFFYYIEYKIMKNNLCILDSSRIEKMNIDELKTYNVDRIVVPKKLKDTSNVNEVLEFYKKKVYREMCYIRDEGGRHYQVSNGNFLRISDSKYIYSFQLDSELHVGEDSPITLHLSGKKVSGFAQGCEEYEIFVALDEFVGNKIISAHISVDPWILLKKLYNKLDEIESSDVLVNKLIKNSNTLNKNKTIADIPMGQNIALQNALNNDISIIWGPPGTGKTYTMSHIAMEFLKRGKSVLMVSHSNVSVDGMILELYNQIIQSNSRVLKNMIEQGDILRFGNVRNEDLLGNDFVVSYDYVLKKHPDYLKRHKNLIKQKDTLQKLDPKLELIDTELKAIKNKIKELEVKYVDRAKLVATTISKVSINSFFDNRKYDVVMFDEASMAYIPHIFEAAAIANEHFICVGDFRQLPPICQSEANDELGKDIFNYLGICNDQGKLNYHSWMVMLNEQRRMYPDISAFSSTKIYEGLLKDFENVKKQRESIVRKAPFKSYALSLIDLSGTHCIASKTVDNSRFNIMSALISFMVAMDAIENGQSSVGIITPYQAQCRLIQSLLYDYKDQIQDRIVCSTVHQFQGSEKNVIIFDSVESFPFSKPGIIMSDGKNDNLLRLINVAITRARGKLIVISNQQFWKSNIKNHNIFYDLTSYISKNGKVLKYEDCSLNVYLDSLRFSYHEENNKRVMRVFRYYDDMVMDKFHKDIEKVQEKVVFSIPDGKLNQENNTEILVDLEKLGKKGIDVVGKTSDFENLSIAWKKMIWESDESLFPIVSLDNKILWYGLPMSRGRMKKDNIFFLSPSQNYFRITAKKTVEYIISITNLQNRVVDRLSKSLSVKKIYEENSKGKVIDKNKEKLDGLALYVYENKKCPKCGAPLKLAKGRKVFITCSSCDYHNYLEKNIVEDYVDKYDVVCPEHHCPIRVGLGYNGVYVRCDEYDHFIKIEDL